MYLEVWFYSGIVPADQKIIAAEKIVCDSSQEKRGSHPVQGHMGKCQGQLRGEEARVKSLCSDSPRKDGWRLPKWLSGKEAACQCRRYKRHGFDPWVGKIPWRRGMATYSSILVWRIPWTEEPGGLQSMGLHRVRHD